MKALTLRKALTRPKYDEKRVTWTQKLCWILLYAFSYMIYDFARRIFLEWQLPWLLATVHHERDVPWCLTREVAPPCSPPGHQDDDVHEGCLYYLTATRWVSFQRADFWSPKAGFQNLDWGHSSKPIPNICLAVMLPHMYKFRTTGNRNKQVRWDQKLGLKQ